MSNILEIRPAGPDHQVVTKKGQGKRIYRTTPCGGCPWVVENAGSFPAEAFRCSARTAYDMSEHVFSCHESGVEKPAACAGFLLRGADNNLSVRLQQIGGKLDMATVNEDGRELFDSYRDMAIANGVDEDDPAIRPCR